MVVQKLFGRVSKIAADSSLAYTNGCIILFIERGKMSNNNRGTLLQLNVFSGVIERINPIKIPLRQHLELCKIKVCDKFN